MRNDATYLKELETTTGQPTKAKKQQLEHKMGFNYRQVIGEAIFAMTLCRIDSVLEHSLINEVSNSASVGRVRWNILGRLTLNI